MKKRIIVLTPMYTGSTLLFNLIREVYNYFGLIDYVISGFRIDFAQLTQIVKKIQIGKLNSEKLIFLSKAHYFSEVESSLEHADFIVGAKRDFRDVLATTIRRGENLISVSPLEYIPNILEYIGDLYTNKHPFQYDYMFFYEKYKTYPFDVIEEVIEQLEFEANHKCIKWVFDRVEYQIPQKESEFNEYLWTQHHIGPHKGQIGTYKLVFEEDDLYLINERLIPRMEKFYPEIFNNDWGIGNESTVMGSFK